MVKVSCTGLIIDKQLECFYYIPIYLIAKHLFISFYFFLLLSFPLSLSFACILLSCYFDWLKFMRICKYVCDASYDQSDCIQRDCTHLLICYTNTLKTHKSQPFVYVCRRMNFIHATTTTTQCFCNKNTYFWERQKIARETWLQNWYNWTLWMCWCVMTTIISFFRQIR